MLLEPSGLRVTEEKQVASTLPICDALSAAPTSLTSLTLVGMPGFTREARTQSPARAPLPARPDVAPMCRKRSAGV